MPLSLIGGPSSRSIHVSGPFTLPNEQHMLIPKTVVRWSRGQQFAVKNLAMELHTQTRLRLYVKRLAQEPMEMDL